MEASPQGQEWVARNGNSTGRNARRADARLELGSVPTPTSVFERPLQRTTDVDKSSPSQFGCPGMDVIATERVSKWATGGGGRRREVVLVA